MSSLQDLVANANTKFIEFLACDSIIPAIKNHDPLLRNIFTFQNCQELISYINQQHAISNNDMMLSCKLPYMATEILSCEFHIITDLIFTASDGKLLRKLLTFLKHPPHYMLASYFNRAMLALTKRVFSPSHKYNQILCDAVFEEGCLLLALNHLYAESTCQFILKWLSLKSAQNQFLDEKRKFITTLIEKINGEEKNTEIRQWKQEEKEGGIALVMLLMRSGINSPPTPQNQHKNPALSLNPTTQNFLYTLTLPFLKPLLLPCPHPHRQKLMMMKKILNLHKVESDHMNQNPQEENSILLNSVIDEEVLIEGFQWGNELLCQQADGNNKKYIISILELLQIYHQLSEMKDRISEYYEEKEEQHVRVIIKLLKLKNNMISNILSRILMPVLKDLNCEDFSRRLLHDGLTPLFDDETNRPHVIKWGKVILSARSQKQHIYESVQEEAQWQHMNEVINQAELVQIGRYKFSPSHLQTVYSMQAVRHAYLPFLREPVQITYEEKPIKVVQQNVESYLLSEREEEEQGFWLPSQYLQFDLNVLIAEL